MITSISNKKIKELLALVKKSSVRKKQNAYIVEGIRMFKELEPEEILEVFVSESFENENKGLLKNIYPDYEKHLRDETFKKHTDKDGNYHCACCGFTDKTRVPFQVDHIVAMNSGGKSVVENLQILCRSCNGEKSDK